MLKTLRIAMNRYPTIPMTLREDPGVDKAGREVTVNLASLYHHYFLDSFGIAPPNPDPAQFEHAQFLLPTPECRFQGGGLGVSPAIRRHRSNELGQAFCRWLLYEHFGVTYFAHVERLLARQASRTFLGCSLDRIASGDTPDYLCAKPDNSMCLAEAKGRYSAVSFTNKEFGQWRKQFDRIAFKDASGTVGRLKGHVVATRFATETDSDKLRSTIYAEDPFSPGERDMSAETSQILAGIARDAHYSDIANKLRQPLLASALSSGVPMPEELRVSAVAWRVTVGPLQNRRFVGGYYAVDGVGARLRDVDGRLALERADPLRLDVPGFTFFGVEEDVFRQVVAIARAPTRVNRTVATFQDTAFFYSGFSVFRDGTALGPLEFFLPAEQLTI